MSKTDKAIEERDCDLFDRIAKDYARKDRIPSTRLAREYLLKATLEPVLKDGKLGSVVEIACGVGASARYLAGTFERYIGVDYSRELIERAREFHRHTPGSVEFIVLNVKDLSEATVAKSDCIFAIGALHHFTEIDEVMTALKKIAKPGATFVAAEPQRRNPIVQLLRYLRTTLDSGYSADQRFFSEEELREIYVRNGFKDVEFQYQGFFSPPFAQVIMKPERLSFRLSQLTVALDRLCDRYLPWPITYLSWNIIIRTKFPEG
jgi:ubiquinone/menaquinone biosynthesis C-methylase UbiE